MGFSSEMIWSPEYGFEGLILINARDRADYPNFHNQHWDWLVDLLWSMKHKGLVQEIENSPMRPARLDLSSISPSQYQPPDPKTFAPYQDSWKTYTGRYDKISRGWELRN